jgi:hypothetical protein
MNPDKMHAIMGMEMPDAYWDASLGQNNVDYLQQY